jgi:hypothetical protein
MDVTTVILLGGVLVFFGGIGWAVFSYQRKMAEREQTRSMRYEQMFGSVLAGGVQGGKAAVSGNNAGTSAGTVSGGGAAGAGVPLGSAAAAGSGIAGMAAASGIDPARLAAALLASQDAASGRSAGAARAAAPAEAPIVAGPAYRLRERVLDKPQTLVYYAIKTAVPDHEVFIGMTLADLLDVPDTVRGYDRDLRLKRLAPLAVDYAIVNKAMQLIAVIDLEDPAPSPEQREAQRTKAEYLRAFPVRHLTFPRTSLPKYQDIRQLLQAAR